MHPAMEQRLQGIKVLIVEDDEDSRELLCELLKLAGAQVFGAQSTMAALDALDGFAPDVLVSDIGLPQEDGYVLIRKVRDLEKKRGAGSLPAIALTGYSQREYVERIRAAGFQAHLTKPVDPDRLVDTIQTATGHK
jgi:hypothetical protein